MKPKLAEFTYSLWPNANLSPYACVLGDFKGVDDFDPLWEGVSVKESFPLDAEFVMSPDFPDDTVLADCLVNKHHLIVASGRMKEFFEARHMERVEYLPVAIRDHKGKVAARYYIVNPLDSVDCIDREASGARSSRVLASHIIGLKKLILREDAVPPESQLFRTAGYPPGRIVRSDLADAMNAAGFGIKFRELERREK